MRFKATDAQIGAICVNAVTASTPMGMGFMHFRAETKFNPDDFKPNADDRYVSLDYVQGRMVKLTIHRDRTDPDTWDMRNETAADYQSWCRTYRTGADLVRSVPGVEVIGD